jgi:DNA-binding NarL/FixJ family response regulator
MPESNDARLRLLIADHAATRVGVKIALGDAVVVCGEASTAAAAIRAAAETQPDVCLVALEIPGTGLEAVRGIRRAAPESAVVVLANSPNVEDVLAVVRAGAIGYLSGAVSAAPLLRVLNAVAAGEAALPRNMVGDLLAELRDGSGGDGLTSRESQVLAMLRRGHSTAAIADRLEIAPVTVRRHISQLVRKFGVEDRTALVADDAPVAVVAVVASADAA